jgi:hypothetical protein
VTILESTERGMFKNENPTWEDNQMEIGHDKNQESMLRTSSKKKKKEEEEKRKRKRKKENIELYHVRWYLWSNLMWEEMLLRLSSLQDN